MSKPVDPFETHKVSIRAKGMKVTPFRLGCSVGEAGEDLSAPYENSRSRSAFREGLLWARARKRDRKVK